MKEMNFKLKLADILVDVYPRYPTLKKFCKDYVTQEGKTRIHIEISDEDIASEKEKITDGKEYSPQYLETLAALRQIADRMPDFHRFLCHGAVITWKDQGYMFTAPSGTGKSTHIALWKKYLGSDVGIVNGDKPILSVEKDTDGKETIWAYGTPWAGKESWQKNRKAQLNGICFLKQAEENRIRRVNPQELLSRMICQIYFPDNPETAGKTMELMDRLLTDIPLYLLECDMSKEAVRCSFEMLTGKQMPKNVSDNTHYEEKEEKG